MIPASEMKKRLADRYGIKSDAELKKAIKTMEVLNIALFVTEVEKGGKASDKLGDFGCPEADGKGIRRPA
jgi:hypothetical protein